MPPRDAETAHRVLHHWREAVPDDRMAHLVKDTMRALHRSLQVRLAQHGVQPGHWPFLRILWQRDGLTQRELSLEAGVMEPTTFTALRGMAALGYVTLNRRPDNRKNLHVDLTPAGRALEHVLVPLAEAVNAHALQGLDEVDIATARRVLLAIIANLAQDPALNGWAPAPTSA
jgi:DNA-binding MarR family transcriptional regulator